MAYAKDELGTDKDIQISAEDSREVRELKQIVNGSGLLPLRMSDYFTPSNSAKEASSNSILHRLTVTM